MFICLMFGAAVLLKFRLHMTILSRRDSRPFCLFMRCPCGLLTLRHHNQFVYDDNDNA